MKDVFTCKSGFKVITLSVIIGVALGLIDALISVYVLGQGSFSDQVLNPSHQQMYVRGSILVIAVICGILLARTIVRLEKANEEISVLRGIIPICSYCKKIRDDKDSWHRIEDYVRHHSTAKFSHGVCPECLQREIARIDEINAEG